MKNCRLFFLLMIAISASCAKNEIVEKDMQDSEPIHVKASIEGGTRVVMTPQGEGDQISLKLDWAQSGETFDVVDSEGLVVMKFRQTEDENDDPSEFVGEYTQSGNALKGVSGEYSVVYPSNDNVVYQSQAGTLSDSKVKMRGTYSGSLEKISSVTFVEHLTAIIKLEFSTKDSDIETQDINTVIVNGFPAGEIKMTELNNEEIFIYVPPTKEGETIFYRIITSNSTYTGSKDLTKVVEAGKYYEASIEVSELSIQKYDSSVTLKEPEAGQGTEAKPYIISSPGELKWLVENDDEDKLRAHYRLDTDIEIESQDWTFGLHKPFAGVFDGNGHTISGDITASTDSPVAGFIAQNAGIIKDLEVAANVRGSGKAGITMSIGGVPTTLPAAGVGAVAGVNLGTIEGCVSSGVVSSEAIEDVDGALSGVGGIVGANLGNISGCSNSAEVTGASTNNGCTDAWSAASGIAGITGGGTIENCANTGVINAPKVESGYSIAAGVVGYGQRMPDDLMVRNCTNSGKIKGCTEDGNDHAKTAGIVGFITDIMGDSSSGYTNGGSKIENCQNDGPIIGGGGSGSAMTGGIAAETYMVDIEGCVNNASATVTAGDTPHEHGWCYVGGIVGFFAGDNDICYFLNNTPDLKTSLSECVNNAKITGASYAGYQIIGGIAGEVRNGHVDVCSSHNYGAIDLNGSVHNGWTYAGGITGRHVAGRASVYKCINDGAITGAKTGNSTYGGICGDNASWEKVNGKKYKDRVFDCINYGKMLLPSEHDPSAKYNRGGIVGYNNNANPAENDITDWPEVCTCCKDNSGSTDENGDPLPLIAQGNTALVICEGCSNPSHQ